MADLKITGLTADTSPTSDDLIPTVNDPAGTPANRKVTLANAITKAHGLSDGIVKVASGTMGIASAGTDYQAAGNYITALTSDVTASGPGSAAATIANDAVTNAKLANMATQTIKGRTTAGTGDPEDLTATQATAILNAFTPDTGTGGVKGLVPAPSAGDASKFLKGDGTWATPAGGGSVATDAIFDAKGDLPVGTGADTAARLGVGANGTVLTADSAEATGLKWATPAGGGDVLKVGTPVNNQVGVWTGDGTLEGDSALTFDTTTDKLSAGGTTGSVDTGTIELGHATDTTISRASSGQIAVEGVNVLMNGGALGTPSSGTLTNCSGLPLSGVVDSTTEALGVGSLELGHASDTTISRVSAGVAAIEGNNILTANNNVNTRTMLFRIDNAGSVITTGEKKLTTTPMPVAGTITEWTLLSIDDTSGSITLDIWKDTYANYPPTVADTITASAKPSITTATKNTSSTLTGWTTTFSAGDIFRINVDSVTSLKYVILALKYTVTN